MSLFNVFSTLCRKCNLLGAPKGSGTGPARKASNSVAASSSDNIDGGEDELTGWASDVGGDDEQSLRSKLG